MKSVQMKKIVVQAPKQAWSKARMSCTAYSAGDTLEIVEMSICRPLDKMLNVNQFTLEVRIVIEN